MDRAATRVVDAQRQAGTTLRLSVGFLLAAAVAAASGAGTGPWLALHLFLVGGVVMAIAAATQLLAVTWSAAPAPADRLVVAQRCFLGAGAVAVALGRELEQSALAAAGGVGVLTGLGLLAASLVIIRRGGRNDRFHPAIDAYLGAVAWAGVGVIMGIWMVQAQQSASWLDVRAAHVTINVFGLVGLVIAGTLPAFVATQVRTRMHARATARNQRRTTAVLAVGVAVTAAGQLTGTEALAAAGRLTYLLGWLGVLALLPRLGRRQLDWAGPRLVQLLTGIAWWIAIIATAAVGDLDGRVPSTDLLVALAVGGIAQILVASLAYLGPVIRAGGHERLRAGFDATRSWTSVVAANVAAAALVAGWRPLAAVAIGVWGIEVVRRAVRLRARAPVPVPAGSAAGGA